MIDPAYDPSLFFRGVLVAFALEFGLVAACIVLVVSF